MALWKPDPSPAAVNENGTFFFSFELNEPKKALATFRFWQKFLVLYICKSNFSKMSLIGLQGGWKERVWGKGGPPEKRGNVNCSRVYRKQKLSQAEDIVHYAEGFKGLIFQDT